MYIVQIVFNDSEGTPGDVYWGPFPTEAEAKAFADEWDAGEDTEVEDIFVIPLNAPDKG
jgi:hypothetical protein